MALVSDTALQNLRLKKQESSLMKVQKYEQIADRLISNADLQGWLFSSCLLYGSFYLNGYLYNFNN